MDPIPQLLESLRASQDATRRLVEALRELMEGKQNGERDGEAGEGD